MPNDKKKSPKQMSTVYRDHARNKRKPAPYGRYEDRSPIPAKKSVAVRKSSKSMISPSKTAKDMMPKKRGPISLAAKKAAARKKK